MKRPGLRTKTGGESCTSAPLTAAASGDEMKTREIVNDATAAEGVPPTWEPKITAQLHLFNGRVGQALRTLNEAEACGQSVDDPGAVALLALAYLQSGRHDEYIRTRERLQELKSKSNLSDWSPEDRLLVGQAEQFGNIVEGERTIQSVLSEHPSPLALAFHSQALMKMCYDDPDETRRAQSLEELNAAKLMMPGCPFLAVLELWAYIPFDMNEDIPPDRRDKILKAVDVLNQYGGYSEGRHALACWADRDGRPDEAQRHWEPVVGGPNLGHGGFRNDYYAAFEYRQGNIEQAERLLRDASSDSVLAAIHLGEMLALRPGREDDARHVYEEAAKTIDGLRLEPDDFVGIPETILVLVDGPEGAARELGERIKSTTSPWQRRALEFLTDRHVRPEELLASIDQDSRNMRAMTHKLIALRHLSCGEVPQAIQQLQACLNVNYWLPDSMWAHAFLAQLTAERTQHESPNGQ